MERKLRKCPVCGEWFNTTAEIMVKHFQEYHERAIMKATVIAELAVKRSMLLVRAEFAPWPTSSRLRAAAAVISNQIDRVIAEPA